jgi:hypothetical protein
MTSALVNTPGASSPPCSTIDGRIGTACQVIPDPG